MGSRGGHGAPTRTGMRESKGIGAIWFGAIWFGAAVLTAALTLAACGSSSKAKPTTSTSRATTTTAPATSLTPPGVVPAALRYETGTPTVTDIWVDPTNGNDQNGGSTRDRAKKTIAAAWDAIPQGTLTQGFRIALTAGTYPQDTMPDFWRNKVGVRTAPIIVESVDGAGRAVTGSFRVFGVGFFYVIGVRAEADVTAFRCEQCDHVLLRNVTLAGVGDATKSQGPGQTLKVAQSTNFFVESADISGSAANAIDFDAVQTGRILGSRIHRANGWCLNVTGGSAALAVEANELWGCTSGGIAAGQVNAFASMTPPYLGYQVYGMRAVNNVVHEVEGPLFGASGAYDTLFAFNTAYRVGRADHVIEVTIGSRGCVVPPSGATASGVQVTSADQAATALCEKYLKQGGWGTTGTPLTIIPTWSVGIYNNVVYNPPGYRSATSQFAVAACRPVDTAATNVPGPACADNDLVFKGNIIWNGPKDFPLGVGGKDQGCGATNPTCNGAVITRDNAINTIEPRLASPTNGKFEPAEQSPLLSYATATIPPFKWGPFPPPPAVPDAAPDPSVTLNYAGATRDQPTHAGAF